MAEPVFERDKEAILVAQEVAVLVRARVRMRAPRSLVLIEILTLPGTAHPTYGHTAPIAAMGYFRLTGIRWYLRVQSNELRARALDLLQAHVLVEDDNV